MSTPESKVKKWIDMALKDLGAWWYNPVPTGFGKKGVPDKLVCIPVTIDASMVGMRVGIFVGIEAKADGKKPTPLQEIQLREIKEASGKAFVISNPEDLDYFLKHIQAFGGKLN